MSDGVSPLLVLLMWNLLFTGDEPMVSKAKPGVDRKRLVPLLEAGLIVLEKRGRANHIVLTDRAWQWAEENLDAPFSTTTSVTIALRGLLPRLKHYLQQSGTPLAELLGAVEAAEEAAEPSAVGTASIDDAIRDAYLALSGGRWEIAVGIGHLRERLGVWTREEQDEALLRMQSERRLVLYPNENPLDIDDVDRAAALYLGGDPRHLVYMRG